MRVLGVIPARYESTRLPGKPLAMIGPLPMIVRVWQNAAQVSALDRVVIATDSPKIRDVGEGAGAEVVMTPAAATGSDRVAWVYHRFQELGEHYDRVINIQGDEPFLDGDAMGAAVGALDCGADMTTLACFLSGEDRQETHVVKVFVTPDGRGVDFSRGNREAAGRGSWLRHIGLYGFRGEYLSRFVSLRPDHREREEKLEQLRALNDGAWIQVVVGGDWSPLGVDTPDDLVKARARWQKTDLKETKLERTEK